MRAITRTRRAKKIELPFLAIYAGIINMLVRAAARWSRMETIDKVSLVLIVLATAYFGGHWIAFLGRR